MTHSKLASFSIVSVLCLVVVAPALTFATVPAAANHGDDPGSYVATQGDRCVPIAVVGDGSQTVSEFYDYRGDGSGDYSSHGTTHLQQSQVSQFFVYHGSEGMSLVFLHDEHNDEDRGGAVTMEITGLPADGSWEVMDDSYGNETDDNYDHRETSSTIDWMWSPSRNDGGAYRGLGALGDGSIDVSADFGENSYAYQERSWSWATNETDWRVRYGEGADDLEPLDKSQDVSIARGSCESGDHTADLTASPDNPTVGQSVTLDASGSTGTDIAAYHWDVDGDGTVDETTQDSTLSTAYDVNATLEPVVYVEDYGGENATATTTVTVRDESPPDADVTPSATSVEPGEPVEFDASGSSDNVEIAAYEWTFGDGDAADGETVSHAYAENGTYDVNLTVTDGAGNRDTDAVTVSVEETDDPPAADLQAPESAAPGEDVTFDASDSTDDEGIAEYRWDVGDDGSVDATTQAPSIERNFSDTGDHDVAVTVVDTSNQTDSTSATVAVSDNSPPTARASADPTTVTAGDEVTFAGTDSSDSQGITSYSWEFGDGNAADGETVTHTYAENDTYEATLTVTDDADNRDTDTVNVTVEPGDDSGENDGDEDSDDSDGSDDSDDSDDSDNTDGSDDTDNSDDSDDSDDSDGSDDSDNSDNSDDSSSGSPSSGGSSGGTGGAPPADDSASASVSQSDDGALVVTIENAAEGEAVSADVPDAENGTGLRAVEVVPATDADRLNVTLVPDSDVSAPTGTDAGIYELRSENGTDVESVTYEFAVDSADVGGSDAIRILATNGSGVTALDHSVVENGSTTVVEATTDDVERVVVAAVAPDVSASSLATDGTATAGQPATIEATLANDGHADANQTVELTVDGAVVDAQTVTVPAGGEATVAFETTFDAAGDTRVSVAGTERTISVASPDGATDTELSSATEGPSDDSSTTTEISAAEPTSSNTGLALAGFGVLVIGAVALIRIL